MLQPSRCKVMQLLDGAMLWLPATPCHSKSSSSSCMTFTLSRYFTRANAEHTCHLIPRHPPRADCTTVQLIHQHLYTVEPCLQEYLSRIQAVEAYSSTAAVVLSRCARTQLAVPHHYICKLCLHNNSELTTVCHRRFWQCTCTSNGPARLCWCTVPNHQNAVCGPGAWEHTHTHIPPSAARGVSLAVQSLTLTCWGGQAWEAMYPSGEAKARLLLFAMDPSNKLFKVSITV